MKISKSKQELARIISENGGWCGAANLALFGKVSGRCYMLKTDEWPEYDVTIKGFYINARDVVSDFHASPFTNWHQTILSRDEYFHLYPAPDANGWIEWNGCEPEIDRDAVVEVRFRDGQLGHNPESVRVWCWTNGGCDDDIIAYRLHKPEQSEPEFCESVTRSIPEPAAALTLDQLLQDWRNADDYAQRKRAEADEAAAMRDERWQAVQARAGEMGVKVERCDPELVITDWVDLMDGDVIEVTSVHSFDNSPYGQVIGKLASVVDVGDPSNQMLKVRAHPTERELLIDGFKFIRRP